MERCAARPQWRSGFPGESAPRPRSREVDPRIAIFLPCPRPVRDQSTENYPHPNQPAWREIALSRSSSSPAACLHDQEGCGKHDHLRVVYEAMTRRLLIETGLRPQVAGPTRPLQAGRLHHKRSGTVLWCGRLGCTFKRTYPASDIRHPASGSICVHLRDLRFLRGRARATAPAPRAKPEVADHKEPSHPVASRFGALVWVNRVGRASSLRRGPG